MPRDHSYRVADHPRGLLARALALLAISTAAFADGPPVAPQLPVEPELFLDVFTASEGLTFNGEGELFVGADSAIWRVSADGSVERVTDVYTHLGQAGIGARDVLAADFGSAVALRGGPNVDGIIWRRPQGPRSSGSRCAPAPGSPAPAEPVSWR